MLQHQDTHIFTGLQQDLSISKMQPNYLIDALNIRITAIENSTMLSITNERGPKPLISFEVGYYTLNSDNTTYTWNVSPTQEHIQGTYVGSCVINSYYILFTHTESCDYIYRIELPIAVEDTIRITILFKGTLNFSLSYSLSTLASFENISIQKVYWTDNLNQPRIINVAPYADKCIDTYTYNSFDFCPELSLNETIEVEKKYTDGSFAPGVIQYAITYYNKFRQETAIAYTTPLYYISHWGRGASPTDTCSNSFKLTISNYDSSFEYLRIYSIQRTSKDGEAICKQLEDIYIKGSNATITFTDTGLKGSTIASTDLMYKGGQSVLAKTISQKDGTLFLGGITLLKPAIPEDIIQAIQKPYNTVSPIIPTSTGEGWYYEEMPVDVINSEYSFHLSSENCASFKFKEYYRFGIQFQYKTGEWSDPIWIGDTINSKNPIEGYRQVFKWNKLTSAMITTLYNLGYRRARGVMAQSSANDRIIAAQGVANCSMFRPCDRYGLSPSLDATEYAAATKNASNGTTYAQSSYLFRPYGGPAPDTYVTSNYGGYVSNAPGEIVSVFDSPIKYTIGTTELGTSLRSTEIGGYLKTSGRFHLDYSIITINSPELIWDSNSQNANYESYTCIKIGKVSPTITYGDMDVSTSSTTISSSAKGFIRRAFATSPQGALISQYCYQDSLVDDDEEGTVYEPHSKYPYPALFPMYMWQPKGPIGNDINRSEAAGVLSTKIISNYRYATTEYNTGTPFQTIDLKTFTSDEISMVKLGTEGYVYFGNVDTVISQEPSPILMAGLSGNAIPMNTESKWDLVTFASPLRYALIRNGSKIETQWGLSHTPDNHTLAALNYFSAYNFWIAQTITKDFGDEIPGLTEKTNPIRMRYKSTPHLVMLSYYSLYDAYTPSNSPYLYLMDISRNIAYTDLYGGTSETALKAITWLPCSLPISLSPTTGATPIVFKYGDTYYQRWDCLKTYAWSSEDSNQVIDVMSFPVESHINMDGRYDRNRGQHSCLHISPQNFNLMNNVYSQMDTYFTYRILDKSFYEISEFPNQVTWSLQKYAGDTTDTWCSLPLTSTYDLDGSKGNITSLITWGNTIYCIQTSGISNILFNERAQITTTDGVPIEISNNYKVEGSRYIADGIGSINSASVKVTPSGIYFIDAITNDLFEITQQGLSNASLPKNMSTYFNTLPNTQHSPNSYTTKLFYDSLNSDVYITSANSSLLLSEKLTEFTTFASYESLADMFNVNNAFYALKQYQDKPILYRMFAGDYNSFFHTDSTLSTPIYKGYGFTYISNGRSTNPDTSLLTKVFTNINYRADRYTSFPDSLSLDDKGYCKQPFNSIRVWNEYQDTGTQPLEVIKDKPSNNKAKLRVWRCQIPRHSHSRDRITNPWVKISLMYDQVDSLPNTDYFIMHDLNTIFYV